MNKDQDATIEMFVGKLKDSAMWVKKHPFQAAAVAVPLVVAAAPAAAMAPILVPIGFTANGIIAGELSRNYSDE